jgi:Voltage gated chloride channel
VAWIYVPDRATYLDIPAYRFSAQLLVWALLAGPVIGVISAGYIRLIGWVAYYRITGRRALFAPVVAFGILGLIGFAHPQLFGNGKDMAHDAFVGADSAAATAAGRPTAAAGSGQRHCQSCRDRWPGHRVISTPRTATIRPLRPGRRCPAIISGAAAAAPGGSVGRGNGSDRAGRIADVLAGA